MSCQFDCEFSALQMVNICSFFERLTFGENTWHLSLFFYLVVTVPIHSTFLKRTLKIWILLSPAMRILINSNSKSA